MDDGHHVGGLDIAESAARSLYVCGTFGVGVAVIAAGAYVGALSVNAKEAIEVERRMYAHKVESGEIDPATAR